MQHSINIKNEKRCLPQFWIDIGYFSLPKKLLGCFNDVRDWMYYVYYWICVEIWRRSHSFVDVHFWNLSSLVWNINIFPSRLYSSSTWVLSNVSIEIETFVFWNICFECLQSEKMWNGFLFVLFDFSCMIPAQQLGSCLDGTFSGPDLNDIELAALAANVPTVDIQVWRIDSCDFV